MTQMLSELGTKDAELSSAHGWLDSKGNFYGCNEYGHEELAEILVKRLRIRQMRSSLGDWGDILFRNGFQKVGKHGWIIRDVNLVIGTFEITRAQYDTIIRWCDRHKVSYPGFLCVDGVDLFPRRLVGAK